MLRAFLGTVRLDWTGGGRRQCRASDMGDAECTPSPAFWPLRSLEFYGVAGNGLRECWGGDITHSDSLWAPAPLGFTMESF